LNPIRSQFGRIPDPTKRRALAQAYADGASMAQSARSTGMTVQAVTAYWRWMGWDRLPTPPTLPHHRWGCPTHDRRWWAGLTRDETLALVKASRRALLAQQIGWALGSEPPGVVPTLEPAAV
jgi:hypothetical protein